MRKTAFKATSNYFKILRFFVVYIIILSIIIFIDIHKCLILSPTLFICCYNHFLNYYQYYHYSDKSVLFLVSNMLHHCVKSVCIGIYSGPYFPAFGLNTDRYSVSRRIQSECGKIRTRINPNMDTFYAVSLLLLSQSNRPLFNLFF